ncbi:MAG: nucleotidyltransferase domain-containing protein [Candidatus Freyarchaeota archaeon]|nr:nucleotidyltransferase domain-containing protein [Candidatus Freyarchaeota archaeon]
MKTDIPEAVKSYVNLIVEKFKVRCIILWGSRARGDHTPHSDYDIIIIADFKENFLQRLKTLIDLTPPQPNIEVFGYTPQEFETMFQRGNVTALDAIYEGIPLYGEEYFKKYGKKLRELFDKGLERTTCTWKLPKHQPVNSNR